MNRPCWNSPLRLIPNLLLLSLSLISTGLAAEIPLRGFTTSYDLHMGYMHLAITDISLQREGQQWRWSSTTEARGIYAVLVSNKPYSETTFIQVNDEIRLQEILYTDPDDKKKHETARFDWDNGRIDVLRKGKRKQRPLDAEVYDYQTIHLLAISMRMQQLDEITVDFYRRGKLYKSKLTYGGKENVDINGETINADIYEQVIVKSSSTIKYYYAAENPLFPVRVEKFKPGKSLVTLTLRKVEWIS